MSTPRDLDFGFSLDPFQLQATAHLRAGRSVLVAAPTGSGKTVVAERAVADALAAGRRAFYTTPIKALSNQKFRDLVARHGAAAVGLLTGDNSINGDAPIVVMTTEVLRNMIYAGAPGLDRLDVVVLDEVHYLEDLYRGPVWEEVIIHLPSQVRLVCLSATVSNAPDVAEWVSTVRGPTETVLEERRPVELVNLYCVADRTADRLHLVPVLVEGRPNPEGHRFDGDFRPHRHRRGRARQPFATPDRLDVVEQLRDRDMLPVIYFIFSRRACEEAAALALGAGLRLADAGDRPRIRAVVERHVRRLSPGDLAVLGYDAWLAGLEMGIAAHHAGMIPPFKEAVEELFADGLVKLVFATETLALGINMPARTVVIERLTKFTGDHHEFLTPGQFTQLTGRAGRRGIDVTGHAVVLWSPFVAFQQVAELAASRSFVLRSAFRPTYNMAANLIRRCSVEDAHRLLNLSFAQYQADKAIVLMERRLARRQADAAALAEALGDRRSELARWRTGSEGAPGEGGRAMVQSALARLKPGDVIISTEGPGPLAVVSIAQRRAGGIRIRVVGPDGATGMHSARDLSEPPEVVGSIELPTPFAPTDKGFQREVAARLRRAKLAPARRIRRNRTAPVPAEVRAELRALDRLERAEREIADLERRIRSRSDSLARRFDDVVEVLRALEFLRHWHLTQRGERLARIYHECDLAVAWALSDGVFDGLDPSTMAGLVSCFTYEHRSPEPAPAPWFPSARIRRRFERLVAIVAELNRLEASHRLAATRPPDPTFLPLAHAWSAGDTLEHVLADDEVSGGDFVRNIRQLDDLLRQLADAAPSQATADVARQASRSLQRGIVAASTQVELEQPADGADQR